MIRIVKSHHPMSGMQNITLYETTNEMSMISYQRGVPPEIIKEFYMKLFIMYSTFSYHILPIMISRIFPESHSFFVVLHQERKRSDCILVIGERERELET